MLIIRIIKLLLIATLIAVPIYLLAKEVEMSEITVTAEPEAVTEVVVEEVATTTPPKPPTADELLVQFSEQYGVNPQLAKDILMCESAIYGNKEIQEYQRTIKTQVPNVVSSASGYFQFLNSTWRNTMTRMGLPIDTDKHDPVLSIEAGVWLLSQDGVVHWLESENCWR